MKKSELKNLIKESLMGLTGYVDIKPFSFYEAKVTSKEDFTQYTYRTLKAAHGDNYDQKMADKMINALTKKYGTDWSTMIGVVKKSLQETKSALKESKSNDVKNLELIKLIKEDIKKIKESYSDHKDFLNDIYNSKYKKVEVSLRYARNAQEIFKDQFKGYGKMEYSNTYKFKSPDYLASFVEVLLSHGTPQNELTVSK